MRLPFFAPFLLLVSVPLSVCVLTNNSPVQAYEAFLHVIRGTSHVMIQESFKAIPFHGKIWRDMIFECKARNVSVFVDNKLVPHEFHEANTLADLPPGYSRISVLGEFKDNVLANIRLEYTLVDSVLATSGQERFAVLVGLPPCTRTFCAAFSKIDVNIVVPGEVTNVEGHMHLPRTMFKSVPLSGAMKAPPATVTSFTHADGTGFPYQRISIVSPKHGDPAILPHQPLPLGTAAGDSDVITVVAEFETPKAHFHVGLKPCYTDEFFSMVIDDSPKGGADLMLELGAAIAIVCAGIPCMCGIGFWCWIRFVKKIPAPKMRETGISSFSYGKEGEIYNTMNQVNEMVLANHMKDPNYKPQATCTEYD